MSGTNGHFGRFATLLLMGWTAACQPPLSAPPPAPPPSSETPPQAQVSSIEDQALAERAATLVSQAERLEPPVTAMLQRLAREQRAELMKLEFRLKTLESTVRKLRLRLAEEPGVAVAGIALDDSLRYTLVIDDEPGGHYLATVRETLAALEANGHTVVELKNYWPTDDNYSGINTILASPTGVGAPSMPWELQFHTPESFQAQAVTRPMYEELRLSETATARKQQLFDQMTAIWNAVPLPTGILERGAVHERADLRQRPRPRRQAIDPMQ